MGIVKSMYPLIFPLCIAVYVLFGYPRPVPTFSLEELLKGPLPQDNDYLVQFIQDQYIKLPAASDSQYQFKDVKSAYSTHLNGQFNQAQNISGLLKNMKNGFFIECGAADGESFSNSLLFEMRHQWTGLLIEANPYSFSQLKATNRKAYSINACLSPTPYPQRIQFEAMENTLLSGLKVGGKSVRDNWRSDYDRKVKDSVTAQCFPFYSILLAIGNPTVHYFSLDVEGVEVDVLKTIPWDKVDIKVLSIEYTHIDWRTAMRLMEKNGYQYKYNVGEDMIFVKKDFNI